MKDRIRQIMESQHMTQQVFAQFIEMSPASLSSIFNGRTKPTLNVVEAIKKKIPDISTEWLLFGSGSMYSNYNKVENAPADTPSTGSDSLFDFSDFSPSPSEAVSNHDEKQGSQPPVSLNVKSTRLNSPREEIKIFDKQPPRRVTEIRVFYDDQTWESFVPAKK
jgi:transcriptional regulator with XRE-family HTH domain